MTFVPMSQEIGMPPINSTRVASTAAGRSTPWKLGDIIKAVDPVYGVGEFIYLLGVASTVIGSVVTWGGNASGVPSFQTALAPATANLNQPLAVAMAANVGSQYGWYQISGHAVAATNGTLTADAPVYLAGSGQLSTSSVAGKQVEDARSITATGTPAAGLAVIEINRPSAQGAIT